MLKIEYHTDKGRMCYLCMIRYKHLSDSRCSICGQLCLILCDSCKNRATFICFNHSNQVKDETPGYICVLPLEASGDKLYTIIPTIPIIK